MIGKASSTMEGKGAELNSNIYIQIFQPLSGGHGKVGGLTVATTLVFLAGEMAGSGVLALPRAVVDAGLVTIKYDLTSIKMFS